jgi:hypothetical protein
VAYNVRDLLGHFVRPKSAKGDMCPHACCRNRRVHPENMPVVLPRRLLRHATDDDLMTHYQRVQGDSRREERARAQVLHEMDRRDTAAVAGKNRAAAKYSRELEEADNREASYVAAEAATRGNMVNRKGRSRDINPRTLIYARDDTFERYASDELKEFYAGTHRPTARALRSGADTRYVPRATEPRRRKRGVVAGRRI